MSTLPVSASPDDRTLLNDTQWQRVRQVLGLSQRELELVQRIFDGHKLAAIARDLQLSLGTVKTYSLRVRQKLRVSDQRELIVAVMRAHISEP